MDPKVYTVSELTRQIKLLLEDSFPALWVEGEISNFRPHHSGHLYFTLKDVDSQISCVMWRSRASSLALEIKDGLRVRVYGTIRLYEKSGRYQLDLFRIETSGLGDLQLKFEQLKKQLHEEGLFDSEVKSSIPKFPQKVGVITSPTSAAFQDILSVVKRRSPSTPILLYGVKVQGEGAAEEIVHAIEFFNLNNPVDVLIVGRGGGSVEDLWAFNEEIIARAVYRSTIPIISAVGHEIDFTITDFVADLRAPTPTAAAELAFPDDIELRNWLMDTSKRLEIRIGDRLSRSRNEISMIGQSYSFRRPKDILQNHIFRIEEITQRIYLARKSRLSQLRTHLQNLKNQLESLNPHSVLNRGYSMIFKDEYLISSVNMVTIEDEVQVRLKDGDLRTKILSVNYDKKANV